MADLNQLYYDFTIVLDEEGDAVLTHFCGDELGEVDLCTLGELVTKAEDHECGEDTDD